MSEIPEDAYVCCAIGECGHEGPCAHICLDCDGTAKCWVCRGSGDDGSGLDNSCQECGGGFCGSCTDGLVSGD